MSAEEVNPYAPPSAGGPADDSPQGPDYRVEGEWLLVRPGTLLPEVDLEGRGEGAGLTPVGLRFATGRSAPPLRLAVAGALLLGGLWIFGAERLLLVMLMLPLLVGLVLGLALRRERGPPGVWRVRGFASQDALRTRWRRTRLRSAMSLPALLLILVPALVPEFLGATAPGGGAWFAAGVLVVLGLLLWHALDLGWTCARVADGWIYLRGIRPRALSELASRTAVLPAPRRRKVQVFRLHRLPLNRLVTVLRWNPLQWLLVGQLKWLRSKALERPVYHWSETEWRGPEAADPALMAWWRRKVAGSTLADWQAVAATRTDAPDGDTRTEEIVFRSPDGRAILVPGLVRFANGRVYVERRQLHARSWATDGRVLATGTLPLRRWVPDWLEAVTVKGSPGRVARRHLDRLGGEDLRRVETAGLRREFEREMEARTEAMEAAGVLGPVEERTMPG